MIVEKSNVTDVERTLKHISLIQRLFIESPKIPARDLSLLFSVFLTSFICNDDLMLKFVLPLK
jgi:hypothetical protein